MVGVRAGEACVFESSDEMSEAHRLLLEIAGPQRSVNRLLGAAHRRLAALGWSANRVRDVYHRDPRVRISAKEISALRMLSAQRPERRRLEWGGDHDFNDHEAFAKLRADLAEQLERLERLEKLLSP